MVSNFSVNNLRMFFRFSNSQKHKQEPTVNNLKTSMAESDTMLSVDSDRRVIANVHNQHQAECTVQSSKD